MKRRKSFLVALVALVLVGTLFGSAAAENKKIVIGATTPPHAIILEALVEDLKAEGFDLEILELTDYVTGNPATSAGDLDANYFQHGPYLKLYNDSVPDDQKLAAVIGVHYEPFGLYAGTKATLEELAEGDHIAIPNDPTNGGRALFLLQDAGLIKLKDDVVPENGATVADIVENEKKLAFDELNAELIPRALQDVAYAIINGNYATGAGLNPQTDSLFLEPLDGGAAATWINYIVVKPDNANADFVKALEKVLYTQKIYDYILNDAVFAGGVVPVFEVPAN